MEYLITIGIGKTHYVYSQGIQCLLIKLILNGTLTKCRLIIMNILMFTTTLMFDPFEHVHVGPGALFSFPNWNTRSIYILRWRWLIDSAFSK